MKKYRIFILTKDNTEKLQQCLDSFYDEVMEMKPKPEIVIIDNNSKVTPSIKQTKSVKVVRNQENFYFHDAFNRVISNNIAQYMLRVEDDVLFKKGAVKRLFEALEDEETLLVAPAVNNKNSGWMYLESPDENAETKEVPHVDTTVWGLKAETIDIVGYPDFQVLENDWYMWGTNIVYCWKIRKAGYKVENVLSAYAYHNKEQAEQDHGKWKATTDVLKDFFGDEFEKVMNG